MKVTVKIAEAHWYWRLFFWFWTKINGFNELRGFTTYWNTVVIRKAYIEDQALLAHEVEHVKQIRQLGWWKFTVEYCKEWRRVGYRQNRFEVNARAAARKPTHTLKGVQLSYC